MTTTAMIMIITIRPPTAPPTTGPMMLGDTNADSDCLVTGDTEVPISSELVIGSVVVGADDDSFVGTPT